MSDKIKMLCALESRNAGQDIVTQWEPVAAYENAWRCTSCGEWGIIDGIKFISIKADDKAEDEQKDVDKKPRIVEKANDEFFDALHDGTIELCSRGNANLTTCWMMADRGIAVFATYVTPQEAPATESTDAPKVVNHLTFEDCERLLGEGHLLWWNMLFENEFHSQEPATAPLYMLSFEEGEYYEVHNGILRDDILRLRRDTPKKLEYCEPLSDEWSQMLKSWDVPRDEQIIEDWQADRYRLKEGE